METPDIPHVVAEYAKLISSQSPAIVSAVCKDQSPIGMHLREEAEKIAKKNSQPKKAKKGKKEQKEKTEEESSNDEEQIPPASIASQPASQSSSAE